MVPSLCMNQEGGMCIVCKEDDARCKIARGTLKQRRKLQYM